MSIFKAYDIRGIVPDELDPEMAYGIGRAVARFLDAERLAVGRDMRESSPEIAEALMRGVVDEATDVVDLGMVTTPMLYYGVDHLRTDGGIMITASHNPGQYNGFKICGKHATPIGEATGLKDIEKLTAERADAPPVSPRGSVETEAILETYVDHVLAIGSGRPECKVAIDCGNGIASVPLEPLLPRLPMEVDRLYFEPDGRFPNHEADPLKLENLVDLQKAVKKMGADFGVAFDGDGDRAIFVDEKAEPISADLVTALLARKQLQRVPGGRVLYDLRSSRVVSEEIEAADGKAEMCRVGHAFVKAQMRETGAVFAGELSGHFYFRFSPTLVCDDGAAAMVALLDVLADASQPLSELVAPLRRYHASGEINSRVTDVKAVIAAIERDHGDAPEVSQLDGLLVRYPDWWFNLRPSNTEPVLRLNLEADTDEKMQAERDKLLARIKELG